MWSTSGPLKRSPSEGRRSQSDRAARSLHSSQSMCGEGQFGARGAQPLNSKLDLRSRALCPRVTSTASVYQLLGSSRETLVPLMGSIL